MLACGGVDVPHHWRLEPPTKEKSRAVCKHCNATSEFSNGVNLSWAETQGAIGFGVGVFATRLRVVEDEED